jgi:hypothetical protein
MASAKHHEPCVPTKVKVAVEYLLNTKADLVAAAMHAQLAPAELRRALGKPHVLRYARAEKKAALEALCLGSPSTLADILRGDNEMARVQAIKTAEALKEGAIELEHRTAQRKPGLQIVIVERDGSQRVPYEPLPLLDVTAAPAVFVPVRDDPEAGVR